VDVGDAIHNLLMLWCEPIADRRASKHARSICKERVTP
jgi:hypothetical protein